MIPLPFIFIFVCLGLPSPCVCAADQELGDLTTFNAEHGYLEALVRGFRTGFLREYEYRQLTQCDVLDDVKVTLGDTDYNTTLSV